MRVFDVALLVALLFFVLAMLGTMQEVLALRQTLATRADGRRAPKYVGSELPREFVDRLGHQVRAAGVPGLVILFLSENCQPCHQLATALASMIPRELSPGVIAVIQAADSGSALTNVARGFAAQVVLDPKGETTLSADILATPAALAVEPRSMVATDFLGGYRDEGDATWILGRLTVERSAGGTHV